MSINLIKNAIKHIKLVTKHKWLVFKFSIKLGIPFRGLLHDLSKFSYTEFMESIKYYNGKTSPIVLARKDIGYSKAWLNHKSKNNHHEEYWMDIRNEQAAVVIPYKYVLEMICDKLSASITYNGKKWTTSLVLEYWLKEKNNLIIHPKTEAFFTEVFTQVKDNGIDKTINRKNIKEIYKKYCIDDTRKYVYKLQGEWQEVKE